ncbi:MAG: hypothetical protein HYS13_10630, partial [Planctomycetia bacterium]|nr:hypothetical protein [Planctomycetia bacterium]
MGAKQSHFAFFVALTLCAASAGCGNWNPLTPKRAAMKPIAPAAVPQLIVDTEVTARVADDGGPGALAGDDEPIEAPDPSADNMAAAPEPQGPDVNGDEWAKPLDPPPEAKGLRRLHPDYDVWIDAKGKRIVVAARVVLREGHQLEMFACLFRTKEHESIVSVKARAKDIHALLQAMGATPGHP